MIHLSLNLPNSIGTKEGRWGGRAPWFSCYRHGRVGEFKGWEFQTFYNGWGELFTLRLDLSWNGSDHCGLGVELCILGFNMLFDFRDSRHWNDDENTWEKYDEESMKKRMDKEE